MVATIPAPGQGNDSGLTWAEGSLWVGQYRDRRIHQIDPATGAIQRTIESNRFVTGVTWVDGEMWHGTWEGDESEMPGLMHVKTQQPLNDQRRGMNTPILATARRPTPISSGA